MHTFAPLQNEAHRKPSSNQRHVASRSHGREVNAAWERSQPKLRISAPGDAYEQDADRVADQVMTRPAHSACACGGGCPNCQAKEQTQVSRFSQNKNVDANHLAETSVPSIVPEVLRSPGQPLDSTSRSFFEVRFGTEFDSVQVHTDAASVASARAINARAYTSGHHIVFGNGQYGPETPTGQRLLAHELAHVVQQRDATPATVLSRSPGEDKGFIEEMKEKCLGDLAYVGNKPGPESKYKKGGCPATFCQPFADREEALVDLEMVKPCLLAGIRVKLAGAGGLFGGVGAKVQPYWEAYLNGGSDVKDLSQIFGTEFSESRTTGFATDFLLTALKHDMEANHAAGRPITQYSQTPEVANALAAIGSSTSANRMNFDVPDEVPGNLVGDFGTDQRANQIGARPSPWDDLRVADLKADLKDNPDGSVTVTPRLVFVVQDTIDLCPGNCGTVDEQQATIPMSRFEATGLTGDVPIIIRFSPPPEKLAPFIVGLKAPTRP